VTPLQLVLSDGMGPPSLTEGASLLTMTSAMSASASGPLSWSCVWEEVVTVPPHEAIKVVMMRDASFMGE
jgi:hypothetical protein